MADDSARAVPESKHSAMAAQAAKPIRTVFVVLISGSESTRAAPEHEHAKGNQESKRGPAAATVHMLFFVAVIKILTASTQRDYLYVKLIAGLELLAAALLSAELSFFFYLGLLCSFVDFTCFLLLGEFDLSGRSSTKVCFPEVSNSLLVGL